jgi:hypothetical protein
MNPIRARIALRDRDSSNKPVDVRVQVGSSPAHTESESASRSLFGAPTPICRARSAVRPSAPPIWFSVSADRQLIRNRPGVLRALVELSGQVTHLSDRDLVEHSLVLPVRQRDR